MLSEVINLDYYCPREKRPEAFRSGAKESVGRAHRGGSHRFS